MTHKDSPSGRTLKNFKGKKTNFPFYNNIIFNFFKFSLDGESIIILK